MRGIIIDLGPAIFIYRPASDRMSSTMGEGAGVNARASLTISLSDIAM